MSQRLTDALTAIDACNCQDPNIVQFEGTMVAKELIYGQRMSATLSAFKPDACELLQIACRAQHLERWIIRRAEYPMDKMGYKQWRTELARHHANKTTQLMAQHGYSEEDQHRVADILQKKNLKRDADTQTLEDVACLVFLEFYLEEFAAKHETEKLLDIIRKTWMKMSSDGHDAALKLPFTPPMLTLVQQALNP